MNFLEMWLKFCFPLKFMQNIMHNTQCDWLLKYSLLAAISTEVCQKRFRWKCFIEILIPSASHVFVF